LPEALNNLGVARERVGKSREAARAFERASQLDPEEVDYWFNLGLQRLRGDEAAEAVTALREVLQRRPEDAEASALLILALERSGQASEAAAVREESARASGPATASASLSMKSLDRLDRIKMRPDTGSLRQLFVQLGGRKAAGEPR